MLKRIYNYFSLKYSENHTQQKNIEKRMIDEWLASDKAIHAILDHPCHGSLMGGLVGVNGGSIWSSGDRGDGFVPGS